MAKNYLFILLLTFAGVASHAQGIPPGYYNGAAGLNCQDLKTALSNIIASGQQSLSYGNLDDVQMPIVDTIRTDDGTDFMIWDIYSNNNTGPEPFIFNSTQSPAGGFCGGSSSPSVPGGCWNKEHTFPRSWFQNSNGTYPLPTTSDLFNVRPTDYKINSVRASYPYATVSSPSYQFPTNGMYPGYPMPPNPVLDKLGSSNAPGVVIPTAFEPADGVKGDVARAYFYMLTRYENELSGWVTLNGPDGIDKVVDAANSIYPSFHLPYLKMMYLWHIADPVDAKEINRNDLVYSQQNNRNPYIDHPEYVYQVWQCTGVIPVTITDFKAVKKESSVVLIWDATHEANFRQFDIERSTDGSSFNKTGQVAGMNLAQYSFDDINLPNTAIVYYRLKMIDIDGKFSYSKTIPVRLNNNFSNALVYPNPTKEALTIKLMEALESNSVLQVTDIAGRKVQQQNIPAGQLTTRVDVKALPAGRYFIKIYNNTQLINQSFVILK